MSQCLDRPQHLLTLVSEHFGTENKENADTQHELANPKKRTKTATAPANSKTARSKAAPTTVLSPKSHNAHTRPRSASKPKALDKTSRPAVRPASPVKPGYPLASSTPSRPSSRAPSRQTKTAANKRPATANGERRDSQSSNLSAGTTIVTKPGAKKAAPARKAPTAKTTATTATKRGPAVKKDPIASPPAAGGRTLRKRA